MITANDIENFNNIDNFKDCKMSTCNDRSHTESWHQEQIFKFAEGAERSFPELRWMHHIPNGGMRGNDPRTRAIQGASMKRQGVKSGVADIFLPASRSGYNGLYIELKRPDLKPKKKTSKGGVSDEQADFGRYVIKQGFKWVVSYGSEEAILEILNYLQEVELNK